MDDQINNAEKRENPRFEVPKNLRLMVKIDFGNHTRVVKIKDISVGGIGIHVTTTDIPEYNVLNPVQIHFLTKDQVPNGQEDETRDHEENPETSSDVIELIDSLKPMEPLFDDGPVSENFNNKTEFQKYNSYLTLKGKIRWSNFNHEYQCITMGIHFVDIQPEEKARIMEILRHCMTQG